MLKSITIACYIVIVSFAFSSILHIPENLKYHINKNGTSIKTILEGNQSIIQNTLDSSSEKDQQLKKISNGSEVEINNKTTKAKNTTSKAKHNRYLNNKALESIPILQKIRARITRSKDAVWATITLTFMCVVLLLAVAQSRMWKDHYYKESQGVPLPNFNERVLFKDVMERKISTMKKFFKKKSKEKDLTELESLLPPSEWDS